MKKLLFFITVLALAVVIWAQTERKPDLFYDGTGGTVAIVQAQTCSDFAATAGVRVATSATDYTPRYIGDALIGWGGVETNEVIWFAVGTTTNDWREISQENGD